MDDATVFMYVSNMASNDIVAGFRTLNPGMAIVPFTLELLCCNWARMNSWRYDLHSPFWRVYLMDGEGWEIRTVDKTIQLLPDHVTLVAPNTRCQSNSRKVAGQLYLHFVTHSLCDLFKPGVYSFPLTGHLKETIRRLRPVARKSAGDDLRRTIQAKELCYECLGLITDKDMNVRSFSPRILAAMKVLGGNLAEVCSNGELARTVGMSTNAFIRLFSQEVGLSPQKWHMVRRVDSASIMLSHSDRSVEEIAAETGFCDRGHFSRVFRNLKEMGPSTYRKLLRKDVQGK